MKGKINWQYITTDDRSKLPKTSGIYCISVTNGLDINIMYIGKSVNLNTRISAHAPFIREINKIITKNDSILIGFYLSSEITQLEKDAICFCNPHYNCGKYKKNRSNIGQQVVKALDGRPVRWLCLEIKIPEDDMSKKLNGKKAFTSEEIDTINKRLSAKIEMIYP